MGLLPPADATRTSTVPAAWAGDIAVIEVGLSIVNEAVFGPNSTTVAPVKSVPVMVTEVPPVVGPDAGAIEVTVGTALTVSSAALPSVPAAPPVLLGVPVGME
jgi:hypothetical protein